MKNLLSLFAGLSLVASAIAQSPAYLTLQVATTGPDIYADGTPVLAGEKYLLVYVKQNATFQGLRSDQTLVDPASNAIVATSVAIVDKNGSKCQDLQIQYLATAYPAGGSWLIVLLDTRASDLTSLGNVVVGHSVKKSATAKTASNGVAATGSLQVSSGIVADQSASAPLGLATPEISGIDRANETAVRLQFKNCSATSSYQVQATTNLFSSTWTAVDGGKRVVATVKGVAPTQAVLTVPPSDNSRFFRVIAPAPVN